MRVHVLLESVQGKVYSRSVWNARVQVSVRVHIEKFSKDAGEAWFSYTLIRTSKLHRITLTGRLILHAEDEEEVKELEAYATREKSLDPLVRAIAVRLQPLILHIEEEFNLLMLPTLVVDEPVACDKEERSIPMYM